MNSVMNHSFSQVPEAEIQRSSFNRSHGHKTTFDAGYLVPIYVDEALPGDTFNLSMKAFARLSTPQKPIMDNMFLESFFFAVPIRLVWNNFQKFMGERIDPDDDIDYHVPYMDAPGAGSPGGVLNGSLSDYMGIPTQVPTLRFASLFHRAYNLIWNEWFRDQNLQDSVVVDKDDGPDTYTDYVLLKRGKRHDYFTSCLPWPQKGEDVMLPLGDTAPVKSSGDPFGMRIGGAYPGGTLVHLEAGPSETAVYMSGSTAGGGDLYFGGSGSGLLTDLKNATAVTLNALREAFQLQRMLERDARGGTRYTEIVRSHFNVVSPDARLQRPEYLGGGSSYVNISPIAQTNATGETGTPQGNLAAMGTVAVSDHGFTKSFTEHCLLIGMVCVRADLTYQQGLNKMFSRSTRYDYYWPALSHLGEQGVLNKELYAQGPGHVNGETGLEYDDEVFGYQERYAEYRYKPSLITGRFRSNYAQSLDVWHLSQEFVSLPGLDDTFIKETPPIDRVVAVNTEPHFLFDSYFDLNCARPMPVYSVPGMIDHF